MRRFSTEANRRLPCPARLPSAAHGVWRPPPRQGSGISRVRRQCRTPRCGVDRPGQALAAAPYEVGAARIDTTPPAASSTTATPAAFANAQRAWTGRGSGVRGALHGHRRLRRLQLSRRRRRRRPSRSATPTTTAAGTASTSPAASTTSAATSTTRSTPARSRSRTAATTVVIVSVVAQGIFENYIERRCAREARADAARASTTWSSARTTTSARPTRSASTARRPARRRAGVGGAVGLNSGIDDYYMDFLVRPGRAGRGRGPTTTAAAPATALRRARVHGSRRDRRQDRPVEELPDDRRRRHRRRRSTRRSACSRRATPAASRS